MIPAYVNSVERKETILFIAYPIERNTDALQVATEIIQEIVDSISWCVSCEETTFIFKGGREYGFLIRAINYARPNMNNENNYSNMKYLADKLATEFNQQSYTILHNDKSMYFATDDKK